MKSALSVLILMALSAASFAESAQELNLTGFKRLPEVTQYQFRDETRYLISHTKFVKRPDAESFCREFTGTSLAKAEDILLVAMSGAPNFDATLKDSVLFSRKGISGVIGWLSINAENAEEKNHHDIFVALDGKGSSMETASISEVNESWRSQKIEPLSLPAICVQTLVK